MNIKGYTNILIESSSALTPARFWQVSLFTTEDMKLNKNRDIRPIREEDLGLIKIHFPKLFSE